ncbi:MAG: putative PEP-binding protein [Oscillatoria sp. PMC 1068.18]|nr:putative PEP-binding protein [Oscillatoria sp. PMC 1076.18]MEC4988533.1 putative PEP-binding protein [Oscillatoria sp. PMC 1068.18]
MENFYWLNQIQSSDYPEVGEKAFALSQLEQRGYPVSDGFVIPRTTFREFLTLVSESEPLLAQLRDSFLQIDPDDRETLQLTAQRLRQAIAATSLPEAWLAHLITEATTLNAPNLILRASLPQQLTGLLPAQICACQEANLATTLKQVWGQLFSAHCLFYFLRHHQKFPFDLAILVQPAIAPVVSGVVETDGNLAHIQANWGFGHSLVRGEILPDSFQVVLPTGEIQQQQIGHKNRAYRLNLEQHHLEAYLLSEKEQNASALSDNNLAELIRVIQLLLTENESNFHLEWIFVSMSESNPPNQLNLTQFALVPSSSLKIPTPLKLPNLIVKGLSASGGRAIAPAFIVSESGENLPTIPANCILVTSSIVPDWLPLLYQAAGVISEKSGLTSHAAIIARELGIPAVIGATNAMQKIQPGESLLIDGTRGEVYRFSPPKSIPPQVAATSFLESESPISTDVKTEVEFPQKTPVNHLYSYPLATQLFVNLSQTNSLPKAAQLPVDGIGLLRGELLMLELLGNHAPNWWLQPERKPVFIQLLAGAITQFAATFAPRPVFYRSTDWRVPELPYFFDHLTQSQSQLNPLLGERGTFTYLLHPELFTAELQALALVQQQGYQNLSLILPFVRSVDEFIFCRHKIADLGLNKQPDFQVWIMAEVPSVLFQFEDYIEAGVQGISIGTNDLTQLLLGVDRERADLASLFDERHPAVLAAVKQFIDLANAQEIPCSICGQAPVLYPELIDSLVRWGITSISVEVEAVERTYQAIARAEQRLILAAARRQLG